MHFLGTKEAVLIISIVFLLLYVSLVLAKDPQGIARI